MEKKQVKVGYWTYEEFCKKFPDFDKIPVVIIIGQAESPNLQT